MSKIKVYIAGPLTGGGISQNVRNAMWTMDALLSLGYVPFCPHLLYWQNMAYYRAPQSWLDYDFEWLKVCDALYRMPGDSSGSDKEVEYAKTLGIPVFYSTEELNKWKP